MVWQNRVATTLSVAYCSARMIALWLLGANCICAASDPLEFFENRIRPALVEHCYSCHSARSDELQGGLRLDRKSGWELGGESAAPAIVPGNPDESPLIRAVRHDPDVSPMPPRGTKLPQNVIADLIDWIERGAIDPRTDESTETDQQSSWETAFQHRLQHWSLQPIASVVPPELKHPTWARTDVDRFVLSRLEQASLEPTSEADRYALARRLSFALTGLPPDPQLVQSFIVDDSPAAYDHLVDQMLGSLHFGERWARHWMDVVHYADTHGYEWDVPAKHAWRYRDYLVRAFNSDLPYDRFVLEQIAGDLLEPRIDCNTGVNEALIGPMMLRLGERRHGDNSAAEGVTQEAVANMIDTLGKAFLGTTLACAQCHDHKLDAIEQRDYYSLAGMLMSTRFSARPIDAVDPNQTILEHLRSIKKDLRGELARLWLSATDLQQPSTAVELLRGIAADAQAPKSFPTSLAEFWKRSLNAAVTSEEFAQLREQRLAANREHLTLIADFTVEENNANDAGGWRWEGFGMQHGWVRNGELVISDQDEVVLQHLLPAGRFTHVYSQRLAGYLQSPQLDPLKPITFSVEMVAGKFASQSFIVDRALNPERLQFPAQPNLGWQTLTAGNFDSLEGTVDDRPRQVYFELATKSLNNYFPPRVGYGGVKEPEVDDPRSWFGVARVYQHHPDHPPQDDLERFATLFSEFSDESDWARRLVALVRGAVQRWASEQSTEGDVRLLNDALQLGLLPNNLADQAEIGRLVNEYRQFETQLQPDQTVGSAADWHEGQDVKLGIRGSYTELGDSVPRGHVRFLAAMLPNDTPIHAIFKATIDTTNKLPIDSQDEERASRRLDWARQVVDPGNPLTARVYVNRIWHYLFGEGLVRTPDDFGHIGEQPTDPKLLDYLASRFVREGWSTKKLIRLLVTSAVWRQSSIPISRSVEVDPENRMWHHLPLRRLEAEAIRDAILTVSGRLDPKFGGPSVEPYRAAEDSQKRLLKGPLDGHGRRSLYIEMTLMEPPRFMALFNQPIPKQTVGKRDKTNVPDQALALLNDPFVIDQARLWSERLVADNLTCAEERIEAMLLSALGRPARRGEVERLTRLAERSQAIRGVSGDLMKQNEVWHDVTHAVLNLKEFIYVP